MMSKLAAVGRYCKSPTALTAAMLGISVGGGVYCFLQWLVIVSFGEYSRHPISYPMSIVGGLIFLGIFIAFAMLYMIKRAQKLTAKGIIADIALGIIMIIPSFVLCSCLRNLLSLALKMM